MTYELRPAERGDVGEIARIWQTGWVDGHLGHVDQRLVDARTAASFLERSERSLAQTTVASPGSPGPDDRVAGFVLVVDDEVEQMYVGADHRGSGCAARLLQAAERQIAASGSSVAWLAVVAGNDRARRFYEKRGWTDAGPFTYLASGRDGGDEKIPVEAHRYEKQLDHDSAGS